MLTENHHQPPHAAPYCFLKQMFYITFYTTLLSTTTVHFVVFIKVQSAVNETSFAYRDAIVTFFFLKI